MSYDLRREAWIPWRRRSGALVWGSPAILLDGIGGDDPVVALATPRPDFDGAVQEFLIGLLSAALQPEDDRAWAVLRDQPPEPAVLQTALDRLPPAFDLDGDGPRFFQDLSEAECAEGGHRTIESLLIGTPNTDVAAVPKRTVVTDLFVKPARIERLGRPAAAMAILTMQTYAPAGGQGHRTSLRGGGPLTTLVDPRVDQHGALLAHEQPLWHKLWANVETQQQLHSRTLPGAPTAIEAAFPWLAPTRTSNPKAGGGPTSAATAHPLEAYFGLPRRIRLEFGDAGRCDLTGMHDERTITGFRMRNYGAQYLDWQHPLTPHYRQKPGEPWLPRHGQPGGIGWRDWVELTLRAPADGLRKPATVAVDFGRRARSQARAARLHVFGYDMDNMKARGWTEAVLPMLVLEDEAHQRLLRETAAQLVEATGLAASALLSAVKTARFQNPKEATGDLGHVRTELWDTTEEAFYTAMTTLADVPASMSDAAREADQRRADFANRLKYGALAVFDRWAPTPGLAPEPLRRRVVARHDLSSALNGYSKLGEQIFTILGVPLPGGGRAARAAQKRARTEVTK